MGGGIMETDKAFARLEPHLKRYGKYDKIEDVAQFRLVHRGCDELNKPWLAGFQVWDIGNTEWKWSGVFGQWEGRSVAASINLLVDSLEE
jgi:hypothetical protein